MAEQTTNNIRANIFDIGGGDEDDGGVLELPFLLLLPMSSLVLIFCACDSHFIAQAYRERYNDQYAAGLT